MCLQVDVIPRMDLSVLAPLLEPDQKARRSMAVRQSPGVKTRRYTYHAIIDGKKAISRNHSIIFYENLLYMQMR